VKQLGAFAVIMRATSTPRYERRRGSGRMDIFEAITTRRSVRRFVPDPVPRETVLKLVEMAINAPSACDRQAWKFIIVDERHLLTELTREGAATFLAEAPLAIIVLYPRMTDNVEYQDGIQSAAAAVENLLLAAHALGLGACWICHLPPKRVLRKLLKIPWTYDPVATVALGYRKGEPRNRPRKGKPEEVISSNEFRFSDVQHTVSPALLVRRFARWLYYLLPFRRHLYPLASRFERKFDKV